MSSSIYDFVFRGILADEVCEKIKCTRKYQDFNEYSDGLISKLPYEEFDEEYIKNAKEMAAIYILIFAFEKSVF